MADDLQLLSRALAGRYHLVDEIGRGGMATVYRARDLKHDRPVALKVLKPHLSATLGADRFLREIAVTAQLDHPHILALLDSGEAEGLLWKAGVPVEMHLYVKGGHAFGLRRTTFPITEWPELVEKWLVTIGVIAK